MSNYLVESFHEFTKAIPDAALLVSKEGEIIAANPTAIRLIDGISLKSEACLLQDIVTEPEEKVLKYLKICSRNSEQIPGSFTIKTKNNQFIECRFKGSRIHHDKDFSSYYILLYFDPKTSLSNKFLALNRTLEDLRASNYKLIMKTEQLSREIAERKKIAKELYQREAQFRELAKQFNALLDANPDNLSLLSPDLRIVWANKACAMKLGKEMSDIVGKHCYTLWHNKTEPCDPCPVQTSFRTGEPATQIHSIPDGRIFELRTIPIKEGNRVVNIVEVSRDITEQRKLEDLYLHSQKMESIGTFAAGIAHDFNNILTGILGYAEIALMTMKDDNNILYKNLEAIVKAAEKASHLTKQLLAFSRQKSTNRRPVDLNNIVGNLEKLLKRIIPENIEVITFLCDCTLVMNADETQIEQVLLNLATNAKDAMPKGGKLSIITEKFEMKKDFIKAHGFGKEGNYALISFSDTGIGMDEETKKRIFDPFFTTKEVGKGTGLGLSVVYGIIKNHEGFISVYSELGRGTTFKIFLPLIEAEVSTEEKSAEPEKLEGSETILLAEDEEYVREFITHLLKQYGYRVIETKNGQEAIGKFLEYKDGIDLLLFDVMMPKKTGKDALDEIRKISPEVKVLFMSGYTRCSIEEQIALDGNAEILPKPIKPTSLLKAIRNKLDRG